MQNVCWESEDNKWYIKSSLMWFYWSRNSGNKSPDNVDNKILHWPPSATRERLNVIPHNNHVVFITDIFNIKFYHFPHRKYLIFILNGMLFIKPCICNPLISLKYFLVHFMAIVPHKNSCPFFYKNNLICWGQKGNPQRDLSWSVLTPSDLFHTGRKLASMI